ncbi:Uncharacterised protein [Mycobacteroides abscessus subsp. abscessus]|nr:Uncharacterised protein [Mycobacteroides abscessus subsp. abscessus]
MSVTSKTSPSLFDSVSSGPKSRKFRCFSLWTISSLRYRPRILVGEAGTPPGWPVTTPKVPGSGKTRGFSTAPPLACGLDPIRR